MLSCKVTLIKFDMEKKIHAKIIVVFFIFCLINTPSFGQVTWSKYYTGDKSESARSIDITSDGGYITVGYTSSSGNGGADIYVIKTNQYGYTEWKKTFGGSGEDIAYSVFETNGGNFIVSGSTTSYGSGGEDGYVLKLDKYGNTIWSKTYGGSGSDLIREGIPTFDGGYIMVGYSSSSGGNGFFDVFVVKTDNNGIVQWSKKIGGTSYDVGNSIKQTKDGDYVLLGETFSFSNGESDFYLVKINSEGTVLWDKHFGGSMLDEGKYIHANKDGSYILMGDTESYGSGDSDIQVIKVNADGSLIWSKTYGGISKEVGKTIEQTTDGGYIICGNNRSKGAGGPDYWLIKTNSDGLIEWDKTYGNSRHEHGYQAKQTHDNGYIITGHSVINDINFEEILLIKVDASGTINWNSKDAGISLSNDLFTNDCENENTQISGQISNYGNSSIKDVVINVSISGAKNLEFNELIAGNINTGSSMSFNLQNKLNTLGGGIFNVKLYTNYVNDVNLLNDTIIYNFEIKPYSTAPSVIPNINCGAGKVNLRALAQDTVYWFHSITSSTVDGIGENFITPDLNESKTYFAQAGKDCPSERIPVEAKIIIPEIPEAMPVEICGSGIATLKGSKSRIIKWYSDTISQEILFTGNDFLTPYLDSNKIYYMKGGDTCASGFIPVEVYVYQLPEVNLGNDTSLTRENKISLNAGNNFSEYLWSDNSKGQFLEVMTSGKYWVMVTDSNGCQTSDSINITESVGIENLAVKEMQIFPNPSDGIFEINFNKWNDFDSSLEITNLLGQTIYQDDFQSSKSISIKKIDLSNYPKGAYLVKISSKKSTMIQPIIIK